MNGICLILSGLFGLLMVRCGPSPTPQHITQPLVNTYVNTDLVRAIREADAGWEALNPENNPFRDYTERQLKGMMSLPMAFNVSHEAFATLFLKAKTNLNLGLEQEHVTAGFNLPNAFDWRNTSDGLRCLPIVLNQGTCGSCYALATATVFSARLCQTQASSSMVNYSPQDLLACNRRTKACGGGTLEFAHLYLEEYGLVTLECQPYTETATPEGEGSLSQKCYATACTAASKSFSKRWCRQGTSVGLVGRERIMNELSQRGPLATSMNVYSDFLSYKSGIYKRVNGTLVGAHGIVLLGWGSESSSGQYWIAQNSWGTSWGEAGYFRASMTDSATGIAAIAYYCIPQL